ncbi:MAG TPA: chemotaxis protein CheW [Fimbriimonadaceae bacterium]|nr:chemotaxis protein CheW [Fimbriimonadaceae bacterium]
MSAEESTAHANEAGGQTSQFLTFTLAGEEYGVDILKVQEIKGYVATTRVPNSPPEVVGVLNLRGTIVPIIDLRTKFGLEAIAYDAFAAIVVVVVENQIKGMVVDRVSEVVSIPKADIQPPADCGSTASARAVSGMAQVGDKLVTLLDVEAILLGQGEPAALSA